MAKDDLLRLPARPDSEFEWEDLLLRLEVMPRAIRVELENTGGRCPPGLIAELVDRETFVHQHLERAAGAAEAVPAAGAAEEAGPAADALSITAGVDRFVRLRSRNFAMLQRRGINVWDWTVAIETTTSVTVFQLLSRLAQGDVDFLRRLRTARSPSSPAC